MIRHYRWIIVAMWFGTASMVLAQLPASSKVSTTPLLPAALEGSAATAVLPDTDLPFPRPVNRGGSILPEDDLGKNPPSDLAKATAAEDLLLYNGLGSSPLQKMWGVIGFRTDYAGIKEAPNGLRYHPIFSLDVDLNVALTQDRSVYVFMLTRFWGQSAADGVGNPTQGKFDFSKRQWDFTLGGAWNYYDALELRAYAYSNNNLNRGKFLDQSSGYNDGVGIENRYYFAGTDFDRGIYNYVGAGYFPSKTMTDLVGNTFSPGAFLTWSANVSIWEDFAYAYCVGQLTAQRTTTPKLLYVDAGVATRPFSLYPALELRFGVENTADIENKIWLPIYYVSLRFGF